MIVQGDIAQQKRTRKAAARPATKDSTAQVRADSIRRAEQQQVAADSLRKLQELLARRREDSLKALVLRTVPNKAFGVGERLAFDINYGYVTAGEAILSIPATRMCGTARATEWRSTSGPPPAFRSSTRWRTAT